MLFKIYSPSFASAGFSLLVLTVCLLLQNVQVLAVAFRQGDQRLLVTDQENVGLAG